MNVRCWTWLLFVVALAAGPYCTVMAKRQRYVGRTFKRRPGATRSTGSSLTRFSSWPDQDSVLGPHFPDQATECRTIPPSFELCYGMEYKRMRLPNLLGHETMREVLHQALPWPPLVGANCHSETRKFLCTLFAPVCMLGYEKPVPPCRSLCESVRDGCLAQMAKFDFSWPGMLNCSRFPLFSDEPVCIEETKLRPSNPPNGKDRKICPPCRQKKAISSLRKRFCTFDFVLKVRVKRLTYTGGETQIPVRGKGLKKFRWPSNAGVKAKHLQIWMSDGFHCTCDVLSNNKAHYMVAGVKTSSGKFRLLHILKWRKKWRRMAKRGRKTCKRRSL